MEQGSAPEASHPTSSATTTAPGPCDGDAPPPTGTPPVVPATPSAKPSASRSRRYPDGSSRARACARPGTAASRASAGPSPWPPPTTSSARHASWPGPRREGEELPAARPLAHRRDRDSLDPLGRASLTIRADGAGDIAFRPRSASCRFWRAGDDAGRDAVVARLRAITLLCGAAVTPKLAQPDDPRAPADRPSDRRDRGADLASHRRRAIPPAGGTVRQERTGVRAPRALSRRRRTSQGSGLVALHHGWTVIEAGPAWLRLGHRRWRRSTAVSMAPPGLFGSDWQAVPPLFGGDGAVQNRVTMIIMEARSPEEVASVQEAVSRLLRERRRIAFGVRDDFSSTTWRSSSAPVRRRRPR